MIDLVRTFRRSRWELRLPDLKCHFRVGQVFVIALSGSGDGSVRLRLAARLKAFAIVRIALCNHLFESSRAPTWPVFRACSVRG
jgi:hypothetical protein